MQDEVSMTLHDYLKGYEHNRFRIKIHKSTIIDVNPNFFISEDEFNERMNKGKEHMQYLSDLYNRAINILNDYNKKNQIEYAYQKCKALNEDILTFANLLFKNYNNDKERWYNNIRRNTYFNIYKVINEDFTHVLNYFKTFNFTNDDEYQLVYAHLQWVKDIISLKDGRIATCSNDRTIKVFDPKNDFNSDIIIYQTPEYKYCFIISIAELDNGNLVSFKDINNLVIWSISKNTYECLYISDKLGYDYNNDNYFFNFLLYLGTGS